MVWMLLTLPSCKQEVLMGECIYHAFMAKIFGIVICYGGLPPIGWFMKWTLFAPGNATSPCFISPCDAQYVCVRDAKGTP